MQDCAGNSSKIHMLVEQELEPGAAERLIEHLSACEKCSQQHEQFLLMKNLIEASLAARVAYRDSTAEIMERISKLNGRGKPRKHRWNVFFKRAMLVAAACFALVFLSVYLSLQFYLHKTFPYQLNELVVRCSDGIEIRNPGAEWEKLRVGDRLDSGTMIKTPVSAESFVSFDGMRLLTEGAVRLETKGHRAFSLESGEVFVASAQAKEPLAITLGKSHAQSNGGNFRIARAGDEVTVGVTSGSVSLTTPDGEKHALGANQVATLQGKTGTFEVASGRVTNPFARLKVSVLDRIKERFAKVISKYVPSAMLSQQTEQARKELAVLRMLEHPESLFQFASYHRRSSLKHAQAGGGSTLGSYYDSLFVPSNRSISMGKQTRVALTPGSAAFFPIWSHDGSMIAYSEYTPGQYPSLWVVRLDDLEHPWCVSQEWEARPQFDSAWAPDDRHVLFQVVEAHSKDPNDEIGVSGKYGMRIAPIDPGEGPVRKFDSPFRDIPLPLPLPIGQTISPHILKLPWGDAVLCANWGNLGYIPIEPDGQSVPNAPGVFLTNFNPREFFAVGARWSPSGSKIIFMAAENFDFSTVNVYILYDVEDILDGFTQPPRSVDDPRIKRVAPSKNAQYGGGFSFDESLVFFDEDVNHVWRSSTPTDFMGTDFDLFYANALPGQPGQPTQIHIDGPQRYMTPSPEGNRIAYCNYDGPEDRFDASHYELRVVSFDSEADMNMDLGGIVIDNSGTNLIVPPGTLQRNFKVKLSTPFSIEDEAQVSFDSHFFAMRLIDAQGLEKPKFIEPMTLTIRYTDDEVAGLDEGMLEIYYYDESDPAHPVWVPLGGTVDPEHNEITVDIKHFSKYAIGPKTGGAPSK